MVTLEVTNVVEADLITTLPTQIMVTTTITTVATLEVEVDLTILVIVFHRTNSHARRLLRTKQGPNSDQVGVMWILYLLLLLCCKA